MYRLTDDNITLTEAIYLCIEDGTMSIKVINGLIDHLYRTNIYCYIYLEWLCNRWKYISLKGELPKRAK